jgi:hypothetical protein
MHVERERAGASDTSMHVESCQHHLPLPRRIPSTIYGSLSRSLSLPCLDAFHLPSTSLTHSAVGGPESKGEGRRGSGRSERSESERHGATKPTPTQSREREGEGGRGREGEA